MSSTQGQFAQYPSLVGKVVVISGGATGIGRSMSEAFAPQGSRVIILDMLDEPARQLIITRGSCRKRPYDKRMSTMDITLEDWDQGLNVNLRHTFFLMQALMPGLVAAGSSSVVNLGSIIWAIPGTGVVPYIASKSAIVGLTKTLANEFGPQ